MYLPRYLSSVLFKIYLHGNIPEAPSRLEADASKDINCEDYGFQDTSNILFSPATLSVIKLNEIVETELESPAIPVYSPLTSLETAQKSIADISSVESIAAPAFSPLTPLVTRKEAINNCSPIPPMSPSTLELFETLSQDVSNVEYEYIDSLKRRHSNDFIFYSELKRDEDFDDDTDSDYVPDSGEDDETDVSCSSVKQKKRKNVQVPESDSSEDETILEGSIQTHVAIVHNNQSRTNKNAQNMRRNESSLMIQNAINDTTIDDIISICQGSDQGNIEVLHPETEVVHPETEIVNPEAETIYTITENGDALQTTGRAKPGRKRKYPDYCLSEKKNRKYMNLPYYVKDKLVKSKLFNDYSCSCKQRCFSVVPIETRKKEFEKFVALGSYEAQLLYILNNVKESEKARSYILTKTKTGNSKPRQYKRNYYICENKVCKEMFLNNFQISSKRVDMCLAKKRNKDTYKDMRGQKQGGWNKTSDENIDFVKNVINSLPKYVSHYRREQNNGTQYLKLGMTIKKIYEIYLTEFNKVHGSEKSVSFATLKRIFYTNFNLRCKSLKKDTCKKCDSLDLEIKKCSVPEEKEILIEQRNRHHMRAEDLRAQMSQDLARAKVDPEFECLTYDLEKTLPLPRIPTNIVFYKRQLWVYNAGIHVGSTDQGRCNVWVEGEAGRGAQEVGSCLIKFIKNDLRDEVEDLVLWSDCCGGQNRNIKIVLMLKTILNSHPNLKTITFKYLESGHSFLPNDTDFSKIECVLKHHERIYTVEDYIKVMKIAKKKKPLYVTRMTTQDFLSTKKIEKKIVNRKICTKKDKVNWLKTKNILLKKEEPFLITMISETGDSQKLDLTKKYKGAIVHFAEEDFEILWPHGKRIPQAKLDDLRSMFSLIPEHYHAFYSNLKGHANIKEDVDGYGPTLDFDLEDDDAD